MLVLGIESTCDETGCALVRKGKIIEVNLVASQEDLHAMYGGVFPEFACRRHVDVLIPLLDEALSKGGFTLSDLDLIAVASGPGLIGALLIGLNAAKTLSLSLNIPFLAINHVEAHLYAPFLEREELPEFPSLGVVLSGGHTSLFYLEGIGEGKMVSKTQDDAIGEAFDKVAKILNLPYPGGPQVELLAQKGDPFRYPLKIGQIKKRPLDFSFSGLKTGVLYAAKGQNHSYKEPTSLIMEEKRDLAASFQRIAFEDVIRKTLLATEKYQCKSIIFGGGVTHNQELRRLFHLKIPHLKQFWPSFDLSLDNAAMIAGLGYHRFLQRGKSDSLSLEACPKFFFS